MIILGTGLANEKSRYVVTPALAGLAITQNGTYSHVAA